VSLPGFYKQVERMIENTALQTKTARAIVRKAGLRPVVGETIEGPVDPVTLIECHFDPTKPASAFQFAVDLTGFTKIRVNSESLEMKLYYSQVGVDSTALDPGDYQLWTVAFPDPFGYDDFFLNGSVAYAQPDDLIHWAQIPENRRTRLRLSFSTSISGWLIAPQPPTNSESLWGFSVAVQVG
jgi:hypothetical protein